MRGLSLTSVADPALAGFDTIIDVRSPSEYAQDHLPGAINLPVMSDQERAQVGTIYKQVSPFDARKLGAALVAANAARHIAGPLAGMTGGWRPLVYCWRGGQRSGSFGVILSQIGWRVGRIEGGYKTWRRLVVDRVQNLGVPAPVVVLDGNTGAAKTAVLARLAAGGAQVIDLEGLANHRGSLFGAMPGGQPGQKLFEGRLATALERLDPTRPVLFEAESSRIGALTVPRSVWQALCSAPRIRLSVPLAERARFIAATYADAATEAAAIIEHLRPLHPAERIQEWLAQATAGDWTGLAQGLMRDHYDPRYERHRARYGDRDRAVIAVDRLDDAGLNRAAEQIASLIGAG
ncbi:MAG: tRNA 2-selenouridine(34) synthase MnmH [Paracoccus sp. (in: a-proteobacteria)]|uniref:tRNA 2-selenouridine(34) synthase MnmH n=1 Tax=Paracoccus sp. TaxID=267 RepID=UPI0026DF142B|nr:tRNA 2-selenouridine(34) synthase MnmH [Paracoccus sp. (in: a-proteobacteria)]MDO5630847.1 tRNA 2-selenouridine(34) synthase MnmH [Paracoccus sp. (in: a-proteobacteria)]